MTLATMAMIWTVLSNDPGIVSRTQQTPNLASYCLIAQFPAPATNDLDVASAMAEELDAMGQLRAITYQIEDPIFREAMLSGKIARPTKPYTVPQVQAAAKALGCGYVMLVSTENVALGQGEAKRNITKMQATLFKNGKQIWADGEAMELKVSQIESKFMTARTTASSLVLKMSTGPLKDLPKVMKRVDDQIGKGQAPIVPDTVDDDGTLNDFAGIRDQFNKLKEQARFRSAELLLRDAIDAGPRDPERRRVFIEFLKEMGRKEDAIAATLAAAQALNDPTLNALAVRIHIDSGNLTEATSLVNELMTAMPNLPAARFLAAELRLRSAEPDKALPHIEFTMKPEPTTESFVLRAVCRALLGSDEGVKLDLAKLVQSDPVGYARFYPRMLSILDSAFTSESKLIQDLFQQAILKKDIPAVLESIESQKRLASACVTLLTEDSFDARYQKSHGQRLLALNLLLQSMAELKVYIEKSDQDSLVDARIDFGEFIRTWQEVSTIFRSEIDSASGSGTDR